ncbi:hypothetical protein HDZ31DRAFT_67140 [Schizophyllum fasciatum]
MVPVDEIHTRQWCLAHQGGFLTPSHADAFGLCTSVEVVGSGKKLWALLRFTDPDGHALSYDELLHRGALTVSGAKGGTDGANNTRLEIKSGDFRIQGCVVYLQAGQRLIMPPGQAHVVFTPVHCTSMGKQFLCYDTLHLTEYERRLEKTTQAGGTNQNLDALQHTVILMGAALPSRFMAGQKFCVKPLVALCRMVLYPRDYIGPEAEKQYSGEALTFIRRMRKQGELAWVRGAVDMAAAEACRRIMHILAKKGQDVSSDYLVRYGDQWRDPGPVVDTSHLAAYLKDLVNVTAPSLEGMFNVSKLATRQTSSKRQ